METNNKLREALERIQNLAEIHIQDLAEALDPDDPNVIAILDTCRDTLAEPIRNCDVGTAMEQGERFSAYCRAHKHPESECLTCPLFGQTGGYCELAWAQMPYEEGGNDGK